MAGGSIGLSDLLVKGSTEVQGLKRVCSGRQESHMNIRILHLPGPPKYVK